MHEQTIAKVIIEEAIKHGKVVSITVEVGDLGHLPANEMKEALEMLTDWKINTTRKPGKIKCDCGFEGEPVIIEKGHDHNVFKCQCGAMMPTIVDGKDIILKEVEVE